MYLCITAFLKVRFCDVIKFLQVAAIGYDGASIRKVTGEGMTEICALLVAQASGALAKISPMCAQVQRRQVTK